MNNNEECKIGEYYWCEHADNYQLIKVQESVKAKKFKAVCVQDKVGHLDEPHHEIVMAQDRIKKLKRAASFNSSFDDMTDMESLEEPDILRNIIMRGKEKKPYTLMSSILIALNPMEKLELPDKSRFGKMPHPFYMAEMAYGNLKSQRGELKNQSIVISGVSGAGKTETSKLILQYLTAERISQRFDTKVLVPEVHKLFHRTDNECRITLEHDESENMNVETNSTTTFERMEDNNNNNEHEEMEVCGVPELCNQEMESVRHSEYSLGDKLMQTNAITEAFGNAKTLKNRNSSRFGKVIQLQYNDKNWNLTGAAIDTCLLEKTRVIHQPNGERNFHIFYQLIHGADHHMLKNWHIDATKAYTYLNHEHEKSYQQQIDSDDFKQLMQCMESVGIDEIEQTELFRLLAGLLHLGNIEFSVLDSPEGTIASIENETKQSPIVYASELLGMDATLLRMTLLKRKIVCRKSNSLSTLKRVDKEQNVSVYYVNQSLQNATYARDTIARTVYEQLFKWLMRRISKELDCAITNSTPYISLLDIFGYENFEENGFEQLMINYANEYLQNTFNTIVGINEKQLFQEEFGISYDAILPPTDHCLRECLDLICARNQRESIFSILDTTCRLPDPSDRTFINKLHSKFRTHSHFLLPHPKDVHEIFIVRHFAGNVRYIIASDSDSFVHKNCNAKNEQVEQLVRSSNCSIISKLDAATKIAHSKSASASFAKQICALASNLGDTTCNFIKCIKPNENLVPNNYDSTYILDQLRSSGTIMACHVLRGGFPVRIDYGEIAKKHLVVSHAKTSVAKFLASMQPKAFVAWLLQISSIAKSKFQFGKTKLFFRAGMQHTLNRILDKSQYNVNYLQDIWALACRRRWRIAICVIKAQNRFVCNFVTLRRCQKACTIQRFVRNYVLDSGKSGPTQVQLLNWTFFTSRLLVVSAYKSNMSDKHCLLRHIMKIRIHAPPGTFPCPAPYLAAAYSRRCLYQVARPIVQVSTTRKWMTQWLQRYQYQVRLKAKFHVAVIAFLTGRHLLALLKTIRARKASRDADVENCVSHDKETQQCGREKLLDQLRNAENEIARLRNKKICKQLTRYVCNLTIDSKVVVCRKDGLVKNAKYM